MAEYSIIATNRTPVIDPGETIEIDLYLSGGGVPDKNRLLLSYNPVLIDQEDPGEVRLFVATMVEKETGDIVPRTGEDVELVHEIAIPGTHVGLPEAIFHPDPNSAAPDQLPEWVGVRQKGKRKSSASHEYSDPYFGGYLDERISEQYHDGHSPLEVRMNTSTPPPGDYVIPIIFNYQSKGDLKQDRAEVDIHVRTWEERHKRKLEVIAFIGVIATLGILVFAVVSFV